MRIEELHLKNFRCFKELDIQFPESNLAVFIGLNGAGKSAILDAIHLLMGNDGFLDGDINIEENEVKGNIVVDDNSYIHSRSSFKLRGKITKLNSFWMNTFCAYYTTTRKNNFEEFKKLFIEEDAKENRIIREKKDFSFTNPKLDILRQAVEIFCSIITNMRVDNMRTKDIATTEIVLNFNGSELSLSQLSDGQKNLLLLVLDIAWDILSWQEYQNMQAEENGDGTIYDSQNNLLGTNQIVLIDEIELHLHPQWQREVLPALQKTFPNIQFIVTTHSPQVLSRVHKDDIFILKDNELYQPSSNPIGRDSSDILAEIMEITKRPEEIQKLSDHYFSLLNKNLFTEAQKIREQLLEKLDSEDPIFARADGLIARKTLLRK